MNLISGSVYITNQTILLLILLIRKNITLTLMSSTNNVSYRIYYKFTSFVQFVRFYEYFLSLFPNLVRPIHILKRL